MIRILVDTDIVIDLLSMRHPFYTGAAKLFSLADKQEIEIAISSLSIANTHYVLSKLKSRHEAREILCKFKVLVHVLPLNNKIIELALNDERFPDVEDGMQYYTAVEFNREMIITRNLNDFKASKLPVMTAEGFLATLK